MEHTKIITINKKAKFNYFLEKDFEAGIVLVGTEVKSLRNGKVNLKDSYVKIKNSEAFVYQLHIGEYSHAHYGNHEPLRIRKLLLHKNEIKRLIGKVIEKSYSLIPTKLYFKNGKVKIEIALAKGKRKFDKRHEIKKRDEQRDSERFDKY